MMQQWMIHKWQWQHQICNNQFPVGDINVGLWLKLVQHQWAQVMCQPKDPRECFSFDLFDKEPSFVWMKGDHQEQEVTAAEICRVEIDFICILEM